MKKLLVTLLMAGPVWASHNNIYDIHTDTVTVTKGIVFPDGSIQVSSPSASGGGGFSATASRVVTSTLTTTTTLNTYVLTSLTTSFALTTASHKVEVTVSGVAEMTGNTNVEYVTVKMDSTDLDSTGNGFIQVFPEGAATDWLLNGGFSTLASPGDTSSHTYAVYIRTDDNTHQVAWNNFPGTTTLVLKEVP